MTLSREQVQELVRVEGLARFAQFGEQVEVAHQVALYEADGQWHVMNTDERGVAGAHRAFSSEGDALEV